MVLRFQTWVWVLAIAMMCLNLAGFSQNEHKTASLSKEAARWENRITGKIVSIKDGQLQVETRGKHDLQIDASQAIKSKRVNAYSQGSLITVFGAYDAKGVLHAQSIQRAKNLPSAWPPDR